MDMIELDWIVLHYSDVVWKCIDIKQTHWNNTVAQKGHCRALFLFFIFFNQRQMDACDAEAFTKSNILSEKLYNQ